MGPHAPFQKFFCRTVAASHSFTPSPLVAYENMLNILGNSSAAMTAAWREALDAGMFASFPGGLIAKLAGRQNTSNFRVAPGEFAAVETGIFQLLGASLAELFRQLRQRRPGAGAARHRGRLPDVRHLADRARVGLPPPGYHRGRPPRNKGLRYPADPPAVEEIIAVMRAAGDRPEGARLRALIVLLWRAGLRIREALDR